MRNLAAKSGIEDIKESVKEVLFVERKEFDEVYITAGQFNSLTEWPEMIW